MKMTTERYRKKFGKTELFQPAAVHVGPRLRKVKKDSAFKELMASMEAEGQEVPIIVRMEWPDTTDDDWQPRPLLVAGARRLEAAKELGWDNIECIVHINMSDAEAERVEIIENLHRQELTTKERSDQARRLIELWSTEENPDNGRVSSTGGRGKKGLASKVAEASGLSYRQSRRLVKELETEEPETEASNVVPLRQPAKAAPKQAETASAPRGAKIESTAGVSLVEAGRKGLEMEEAGERIADIAKAVGLSADRYRDARDVVLIHSVGYLSLAHRKSADEALKILEEGHPAEARVIVEPIACLLWNPSIKGIRRKAIEETQEEFMRINSLGDAFAEALERHGVPYLDPDRREDSFEYLRNVKRVLTETLKQMGEVNGPNSVATSRVPGHNYTQWAEEMDRVWSTAPQDWRARWLAASHKTA